MQVHPDVARLRGDGAPQPGCDAALSAWHGSPGGAGVLTALARYDAGAPLGDLPVVIGGDRVVRSFDAHGRTVAAVVADGAPQVGRPRCPEAASVRVPRHWSRH